MLDLPIQPRSASPDPRLAGALEHAAAAIARLDQALAGHPLAPAFLYRARLEAVRRQASVDGQAIDPWHLAAVLEGLRLRMEHALRIIDRGAIFAAARHALDLHQWLVAPDFDQEGEVQRAEAFLRAPDADVAPLLTAAMATHDWLDQGGGRQGSAGAAGGRPTEGGTRPPIRAALIRYFVRHRLLRLPVPLTGPNALRPDTPFDRERWLPVFLTALADEAEDGLLLLQDMERSWSAARRAIGFRRRNSRAAAAVDILAAAPLISATSLAAGLGMAVKNASLLLEEFCADGIAVEVTHRSRRRIFGLAGLAPLRDGVAPPRRPMPGRGRGRPPLLPVEVEMPPASLTPPAHRIEQPEFDYDNLAHYVAEAERAIRQTRRVLDELSRGFAVGPGTKVAPAPASEDLVQEPDEGDASSNTTLDDDDRLGRGEPDPDPG